MDGDDLKAKASLVENMRLVDAVALATRIGFVVRLNKGEGIVIPAGFLYARASGSSGTEGLRWGFSRLRMDAQSGVKESDNEVVHATCRDTLDSFPNSAVAGPLTQWAAFIKGRIEAEAA